MKGNTIYVNGKECVALDVQKVIVGTEDPNQTEIVQDPETGLNYRRQKVVGTTVYDKDLTMNRNWFLVDIETGQNDKRFFPGSIIRGYLDGNDIEIKSSPSHEASTILRLSYVFVKILELDDIREQFSNQWTKVNYHGIVGYTLTANLSDLGYANPQSDWEHKVS